jgi:hypothetical protein
MVPLPPLIALTLGVLGAAYIVRHFSKDRRRSDVDLDRDENVNVEETSRNAIPKLRRDPTTGIYRP